jgi:hypothetical protein
MTIEGVFGPVQWANVFWVTFPEGLSTLTLSALNTWIDAFSAAFDTNLLNTGLFNNQTQHVRTRCKLIDGGSVTWRQVRPATGQGTDNTPCEAGNVCYLIDWNTDDPRRGGKARTYIPGVVTNKLADTAQLLSAVQSTLTTDANAFFNAVNALTLDGSSTHLVEMSLFDHGVPRLIGHGYSIRGGNASNAVATQRRRVDRLRIG